jgi:hypothetical protein
MFGCGLSLSAVGVSIHSLPLLYLGNVLCGVGYGCAYTPPLQVSSYREFVHPKYLSKKCGILSYLTASEKQFFSHLTEVPYFLRNLHDELAHREADSRISHYAKNVLLVTV